MRRAPAVLSLLLLALAVAVGDRLDLLDPPDGARDAGREQVARVVRVVDGDTIKVSIDGRDETVRYIGIDTPETVKPGTAVECGGKAASRANEALVAGKEVRVVSGRETRDRFGRLLAYVYLEPSGTFVNERLLRDGHATALAFKPNTAFASRFAAVAEQARRRGTGVWACGRD